MTQTTRLISQQDFLKTATCSQINRVYRFDVPTQLIEMVKINKPLDEESLAICTVIFIDSASS